MKFALLAAIAAILITTLGPAKPTSADQSDFSAFAKGWGFHGFTMGMDQQGIGHASWRAGWCLPGRTSDAVVGCDRIDANGQIFYGGEATIVFTKVDDFTVRGFVTRTNGPVLKLRGEMLLILIPHDMLLVFMGGERYLACGADYLNQAPPELLLEAPCGA